MIYRLGLEYVDLYLMHSAIGGKILDTWDAMVELRDRGLARFGLKYDGVLCDHLALSRSIGVANFNTNHLKELREARPKNLPMGKFYRIAIKVLDI